jgi:hypothetical protein
VTGLCDDVMSDDDECEGCALAGVACHHRREPREPKRGAQQAQSDYIHSVYLVVLYYHHFDRKNSVTVNYIRSGVAGVQRAASCSQF